MDPATFVVTALAAALLKEVATDSYKAVKAKLVDVFGLGKAVEMLEDAPGDEDARDFAVKKLAKSPAIEDAEVIDGTDLIVRELEKLPEDTPIGASLTVRDLKAEAVEFRNNRVRLGGALLAERIETTGKIVFEGNEVGDDRKHWHDEHHQHEHGPGSSPGEPHTHWHCHAPLAHRHPHYPDLHHRHGHVH